MRSHPNINNHAADTLSFTDLQQIAMDKGYYIVECPDTINNQPVYWIDNRRRALYTLSQLKVLLLH